MTHRGWTPRVVELLQSRLCTGALPRGVPGRGGGAPGRAQTVLPAYELLCW